jgi:hypothetical protein
MLSTRPDGGFYMALDYDFDVEQFTTGLPFYNIARNPGGGLRKLDDFRSLGRGIPLYEVNSAPTSTTTRGNVSIVE